MSVERKVEAVVLVLARLFIFHCNILGLGKTGKKLAVQHLQNVFRSTCS